MPYEKFMVLGKFGLLQQKFADFCGFLAKKSGSGAQKEARSWGDLDFEPQLNIYIN
jgi:hypothetical protein